MVTQSSTSALRRMTNLEMQRRATKTVARLTKTALVMSTRFDRSTRSMLGHGWNGRGARVERYAVSTSGRSGETNDGEEWWLRTGQNRTGQSTGSVCSGELREIGVKVPRPRAEAEGRERGCVGERVCGLAGLRGGGESLRL